MKILDTTEINLHVQNLFSEAKEELTIISPYIKFVPRILDILLEKAETELRLTVVYGKNSKLDDEQVKKIKSFKNLNIYHCENLHAKIYYNEKNCIITSMNLYDYSQLNNYEVGMLLSNNSEDESHYTDVITCVTRIIKGSNPEYQSSKTNNKASYNLITIKELAKTHNVSEDLINTQFAEQGLTEWINEKQYWRITDKGKEYGGKVLLSKQHKYFNVWPKDIIEIQAYLNINRLLDNF